MNPDQTHQPGDRTIEQPTPEQLADQFAAAVVKSVLAPAPDGLQVFEELAQRPKPKG